MRNLQPHCSSGWRKCFRLSVLRVLLVLLPGREEEEEEKMVQTLSESFQAYKPHQRFNSHAGQPAGWLDILATTLGFSHHNEARNTSAASLVFHHLAVSLWPGPPALTFNPTNTTTAASISHTAFLLFYNCVYVTQNLVSHLEKPQ